MANPTCALIGSFSVRILQYNGPFSMETVQSVYVCFGAKLANSKFATKTAKKKGEYCHSSHWNYQKKPKRLKFFRHLKDGWRRRRFLSASHWKCILLSETECHIINNLLTELARVVLGNIGLDQYSPVQLSRSVSVFLSKNERCDWSILPYSPLNLIKFDQHLIAIMSLEVNFEFDQLANDTTTVCLTANKGWFVFSILKQAINQRGKTRSVTHSTDLEVG